MPLTIGSALPSTNAAMQAITTAPVTICKVPSRADAVPAISPCASSASTDVVGTTRPRNPKLTNTSTASTSRRSTPAAKTMNSSNAGTQQPSTPMRITRGRPKRSISRPLNCDTPMNEAALAAKKPLYCAGVSP